MCPATTLGELRRQEARMKETNTAPLYGGDAKLVYPVTPERALYNEVLRTYANAPDDLAIMDGSYRSDAILSVALATSVIQFNVRTDQANPTNVIQTTEIRIDERDGFVMDRVSLMFGDELIAGTLASQTMLQTFPNSAAVSATPAATPGGFGANATGIRSAYNGRLSVIVNSVQYLYTLDLLNTLYADQAQAGMTLFTASLYAWGTQQGDRNFKRLTPALNIWGSDKIQFTVTLPDPFLFAVALHQVRAVLMGRGILVQGGAAYL